MPIRTIATLAVAVLLGLITVLLVRGYLNSARPTTNSTTTAANTAPVVVAAIPVARGVALQPTMLKVVPFPQESTPTGAFTSVGQLTGPKAVQRLVLRSLVPNEPILPGTVTDPGGKLNLSSVLMQGMRAVSLRSNDVSGVGGFVLPGDRVDILLTRAVSAGGPTNTITQIIADNVLVLGVDQSDNSEDNKPVVAKAVTVQVTPDQAQSISLGQAVGAVSLSLRQVGDQAVTPRRATQVSELGFVPRPPAAAAAPGAGPAGFRLLPGQREVHVTRGTDTSSYAVGWR